MLAYKKSLDRLVPRFFCADFSETVDFDAVVVVKVAVGILAGVFVWARCLVAALVVDVYRPEE